MNYKLESVLGQARYHLVGNSSLSRAFGTSITIEEFEAVLDSPIHFSARIGTIDADGKFAPLGIVHAIVAPDENGASLIVTSPRFADCNMHFVCANYPDTSIMFRPLQ